MLFSKTTFKNVDCLNFLLPIFLGILPFVVTFIGEKPVPFYVVLLSILFVFEKNIKKNLSNSKNFLVPFLIYIGVYIAFSLLSDNLRISSKHLERQVSILVIPLLVFGSNWTWRRLTIFFETYLIVLVLVSLLGVLKLVLFYFIWSDWIMVMGGDYLQFKLPHLVKVHPSYWSYLLIFGNAILMANDNLKIEISKFFCGFSLLLFNLCLLLLAARTAILINSVLIFYFLLIFLRKNKVHKLRLLSVLVLLGLLLVSVLKYMPFVTAKIVSVPNDERFLLWPKAINEIKNNYFLWGEGVGHGTEILKQYVLDIDDHRVNYNGFDLHNQYLRNYLDMGILGFVSLLYLVWAPLFFRTKANLTISVLSIAICLIFFIGMLTESVLSVLKGIVLLSVVSPMVMLIDKHLNSIKGGTQ